MSHSDAPITREGILKAAFEERVRMSVETVAEIEAAVVASMPHCEGSYRHEAVQRRVDNAVKIYCAQLTVDSLEEIAGTLEAYVGEGISEAIREAAEAALERAS